jgi:hypothetical protein
MTATQTRIVDPETLVERGRAFFAAQQSGEAWECGFGVDDLVATILDRRQHMHDTLVSLPARAFDPRPANTSGEPVWSAGQVVAHVCGAQRDVTLPAVDALTTPGGIDAFRQPEPPGDPPVLSQSEAVARLEAASITYTTAIESIPRGADLSATLEHAFFGRITLQAILLVSAWHEQNHTAQLHQTAA